jgi:general secretion pathway protein C
MLVKLSTFLLWAVAGASAVFWGLKLSSPPAAASVAPVVSAALAPVDVGAVARTLGVVKKSDAKAPEATIVPTKYSVTGIVTGPRNTGIALIAETGKPAKAVRVGALVEEGVVLQAVSAQTATLGPAMGAPALVVLELLGKK